MCLSSEIIRNYQKQTDGFMFFQSECVPAAILSTLPLNPESRMSCASSIRSELAELQGKKFKMMQIDICEKLCGNWEPMNSSTLYETKFQSLEKLLHEI